MIRLVPSYRVLPDRECPECKTIFRPCRSASRYCSRFCAWKNNGGHNAKTEVWWLNSKGYIEGRITGPNGERRRVKQHRWIMECHLGRRLNTSENVHHQNGVKTDNALANLEVVKHGEHTRNHNLLKTYKRGYKLNLSLQERDRRSRAAKAIGLDKMGRAAIAKAEGAL